MNEVIKLLREAKTADEWAKPEYQFQEAKRKIVLALAILEKQPDLETENEKLLKDQDEQTH